MAKGWKLFATINELTSKYVTIDEDGFERPMTIDEKRAAERLENKRWYKAHHVYAPRYNKWLAEEIERVEAEKAEKKAKRKRKKKKDEAATAWKKEKQQRHLDTIKALKSQSDKS